MKIKKERLIKMKKTFTIIMCILSIIFLLWLSISWIEIIIKNIDGIKINSWNFFITFPKFLENF